MGQEKGVFLEDKSNEKGASSKRDLEGLESYQNKTKQNLATVRLPLDHSQVGKGTRLLHLSPMTRCGTLALRDVNAH